MKLVFLSSYCFTRSRGIFTFWKLFHLKSLAFFWARVSSTAANCLLFWGEFWPRDSAEVLSWESKDELRFSRPPANGLCWTNARFVPFGLSYPSPCELYFDSIAGLTPSLNYAAIATLTLPPAWLCVSFWSCSCSFLICISIFSVNS